MASNAVWKRINGRMANMQKLSKHLLAVAMGAALTAGSASIAAATPTFQITPSVLGGPAGTKTADAINATTSELLTLIPGGVGVGGATGSGWVVATSFLLSSAPVGGTGLLGFYGIYITFSLSDVLTSGTVGAAGSNYALTSLNFSMFGDPGNDNTYTAANAATVTNATVADGGGGGGDKLLATGNLVVGVAGFDALDGAFLNSTETFNLTPFGSTFFTSPVPFFTLAFDEFNNTQQGVGVNLPFISINNAGGTFDFNKVPEPASVAVFGSGILALGWLVRRRKNERKSEIA